MQNCFYVGKRLRHQLKTPKCLQLCKDTQQEVGIWGVGWGLFPLYLSHWGPGALFWFLKDATFSPTSAPSVRFTCLESSSVLIHPSEVSCNVTASPGKPSLTTQAMLSPTVISTSYSHNSCPSVSNDCTPHSSIGLPIIFPATASAAGCSAWHIVSAPLVTVKIDLGADAQVFWGGKLESGGNLMSIIFINPQAMLSSGSADTSGKSLLLCGP